MKKKLFTCLLVIGLILAQMMSVSANPSKSTDFDLTEDSKDDGYELEDSDKPTPELPDGKKPITDVHEMKGPELPDDKYTVTFEVPNLTEDMLPGLGIWYTHNGEDWFFLAPTDVDLENKTVTFELDDPNITFLLVCDDIVLEDSAVGTAPKTGVTSTWMVWILAAVVLAVVAVMIGKKKRA